MNNSLYLGIDVSKGYADFCMLTADKKVIGQPFQLFDIPQGYEALEKYLRQNVEDHKPESIYVAAESTGTYENHWLDYLYGIRDKYPLQVARLNPLGVAKHRQADMREQVTDKSSSVAIARYLINHSDKVVYNNPDSYYHFRIFLNYIELLNKQKVQLINNLRMHLYQYFPEVLPFCRSKLTESLLELLTKYPTSGDMAKSRQGKCNQIPYFTAHDWRSLRQKCKSSIDMSGNPFVERMMVDSVRQIESYNQQIDEMYDLLYEQLPQDQLKILRSIKGVGKRTAVILLCQIGDVKRFEGPHQIVGYFGLYPVIKESGDGKKRPHMSKRGNGLLRKSLFMSALSACRFEPYFKNIYQKAIGKGMTKKAATCKVMKKMLRMIYGMLKHNQCFDPKIDATYREKYEKQQKAKTNHSIKGEVNIQNCDLIDQAPVSRKNAHHRKEQTSTNVQTRSSGR